MNDNLTLKWFVGVGASGLVGMDDSLRMLAIVLGIIVSLLTIANLSLELVKKIRGKK